MIKLLVMMIILMLSSWCGLDSDNQRCTWRGSWSWELPEVAICGVGLGLPNDDDDNDDDNGNDQRRRSGRQEPEALNSR